jgi:hypothetical protein
MYFASVLLLMFVLPVFCILVQSADHPFLQTLPFLTLKWFVFWAVGVRLFIAGIRQVVQPSFTAEERPRSDRRRSLLWFRRRPPRLPPRQERQGTYRHDLRRVRLHRAAGLRAAWLSSGHAGLSSAHTIFAAGAEIGSMIRSLFAGFLFCSPCLGGDCQHPRRHRDSELQVHGSILRGAAGSDQPRHCRFLICANHKFAFANDEEFDGCQDAPPPIPPPKSTLDARSGKFYSALIIGTRLVLPTIPVAAKAHRKVSPAQRIAPTQSASYFPSAKAFSTRHFSDGGQQTA